MFLDSIKSDATKMGYDNSIKRYIGYRKLSNPDMLLAEQNPRVIENQIIDYVRSLRYNNLAYASIVFNVSPIITFYDLNNITLNRKKISRYYGEHIRVVKDRGYSTEEIATILQTADIRMRMIILLLSSTGCRVGALPSVNLSNLTFKPEYGLYKIVFYESSNSEYYTFTTRECASAINNYLTFRSRQGEKLSFDQNLNRWMPNDTPLIRLMFDINDTLEARNPKRIRLEGLRTALHHHMVRCGLRQTEHPTEDNTPRRVRKEVALTNGFRKHVISTFIDCGLNHEIRELIADHATGLDANYFRPSEDQVLEEYLKAESYLTIDPAARLARENQELKVEQSSLQVLREEVDKLKELLKPD
jgi:hypothetical protein